MHVPAFNLPLINCRETSVVRSAADQLQIDTNRLPLEGCEVAESPNVPTIADNVPATSEEPSEVLENHRLSNGHSLSAHGEDKDMEIALEQQAQLIQQYEAEEKAQRDWEEKFRETNSRIPVCLAAFTKLTFYYILLF